MISAEVFYYKKRERHSKKHLQKLLFLKKDTVLVISSRALYLQKYSGLREIGTYPRALEQGRQRSTRLIVFFLLHWPPGSSDLNPIEHIRVNLGRRIRLYLDHVSEHRHEITALIRSIPRGMRAKVPFNFFS